MKLSNIKQAMRRNYLQLAYKLERFKEETKGIAAVEFALLAPLMILMYIGTIEISGAMSANRKLSRVSSAVGDLLTQAECYTDATLTDIMKIADDIMYPYSATLGIQVSGVQITGGNATVQWSRGYGTSPATVGAPYTVPNKIKTDGNFLLAAKINMAYYPAIGWLAYDHGANSITKDTTAINMSEEMFLRPRVGDEVTIEASCS